MHSSPRTEPPAKRETVAVFGAPRKGRRASFLRHHSHRQSGVKIRASAPRGIMNVLIYLVPMALALSLTGLAVFLWSLRNGQYDDIEGAAPHVLCDEDIPPA